MVNAGDRLPDFTLYDGNEAVTPASLRGRRYVLFFYPKDDTAGCTAEACSFRDAYQDFVDAGIDVFGVSSDDAASHERFAGKHRLPYRLLSDPGGAARKALGIKKTWALFPGRATFAVDENCTIVHTFDSQFEPLRHVNEMLRALLNTTTSRA